MIIFIICKTKMTWQIYIITFYIKINMSVGKSVDWSNLCYVVSLKIEKTLLDFSKNFAYLLLKMY